ncbi:MAG TPA: ectonucleotide pyrophosphatase/phosphodiesterase [Blastocatellia bacterium]|nr:ectonucleotide pyrophosphatase/phosphodiesterase [Blastocatellia bacterium]
MKTSRTTVRALVIVVGGVLLLSCLASRASLQDSRGLRSKDSAYVIIVSVDGLPADYYTSPASYGLRVPNLTRMKLAGAYAAGVEGIYPTATYPAHTTMVTGVRPATHGIVQNRIFEPPDATQTRAWYWYADAIKSETLWALAKKAGLTTAAVSWPVTVGAEIDYNVPEFWAAAENVTLFGPMTRNATPGLVEKIVAWTSAKEPRADDWRTIEAEYLITNLRPNLLIVHLLELDGVHHTYGPGAREALDVVEREDSYVGRIVDATRKAGTFDKTTFIIVSDHGFGKVVKRYTPGVTLVREKLVTVDAEGKATNWKAAVWPAGGSCAIVLRDPKDTVTAKKLNDVFSKMADQGGSPVSRVVTRAELDKMGAIPQAALMLEAASDFSFDEGYTGPEVRDSGNYRGTHGYLPGRAEMRSALILFGHNVRGGARIQLARMIDIAPTAAGLLGLVFSEPEGSAITELLKPGAVPLTPPLKKKKNNQ